MQTRSDSQRRASHQSQAFSTAHQTRDQHSVVAMGPYCLWPQAQTATASGWHSEVRSYLHSPCRTRAVSCVLWWMTRAPAAMSVDPCDALSRCNLIKKPHAIHWICRTRMSRLSLRVVSELCRRRLKFLLGASQTAPSASVIARA